MSGIKYILRNECTTPALITYQNYSNQLWQYQVEFLPGQTRTIWATEGTLTYDLTRTCIKVLSKTIFPPTTTPTPSNPIVNVSYKNQTLMHVSTMPTSDNWEFTVLNWENVTITGPVDLGFDTNDWNLYDFYACLNGYLLIFDSNSGNNKKIYFVDKNGSIKYIYTANTNNFDYSVVSNRFGYFVDYPNNKFIFTDFSSTIVYDIPSNSTDFYVDNNYDEGNTEGIIVYQELNNYSEYILFKPSGYQTLFNYNNNDYNVNSIVYYKSDFFVIEVYSNNDDQYSFLNIYNKNGTLINSLNLEYNNPTSVNGYNLNNSSIDSSITGTFAVSQSSTSGDGSGVTFQIILNSGNVNAHSIGGRGTGYNIGDVITINGTQFGGISGDDNVTFTVTSLGNFQYNNHNVNFFGNGKMQIIYSNNVNTQPYYIVIYDGIENEFYITSHDKETYLSYYYSYYTYCDYLSDISYNNSTISEDCYISFYDGNGSYDGSLYSVYYCDIVSWYNTTKEFSVYEFAYDEGNYYIGLYNYYLGNSLMLYSNRDDNYIHYEVFQPTGHTTVDVVLTSSLDSWNFYTDSCGEALLSRFYFLGSNENLFTLHKYDGTLIDTLYNAGGYVDWQPEYNMLYMVNNTTELAHYWNSSLNSIQSTQYLNDWSSENNYFTTTNHNNGNIYAVDTDNYQSIIYTQSSKSVTRLIPYVAPYLNWRIGTQLAALLTYNNSNRLVVRVYDLNYNLLNTVTTNETSRENFDMNDNRIFLTTESGSNYIHYLITASTFKKTTVSDYDDSWNYNLTNWC
jgi:hypothetical protein